MRKASSKKRSVGSPTARIVLFSKSSKPENISITVPSGAKAKALIVKSRRLRSSFKERTNSTLSGRRKS